MKCLLTMRSLKQDNTWTYYKLCNNEIVCIIDCNKMIFSNLPDDEQYIYAIKPLYILDKHIESKFEYGYFYIYNINLS